MTHPDGRAWAAPTPGSAAAAALGRWKEGRTGQPLVDANMRELLVGPLTAGQTVLTAGQIVLTAGQSQGRTGQPLVDASMRELLVGPLTAGQIYFD